MSCNRTEVITKHYDNGNIEQETFIYSNNDSCIKTYDSTGRIIAKELYKNGQKNDTCEFWSYKQDSIGYLKEVYINDTLSGVASLYYNNYLFIEGYYYNGKAEGSKKGYFLNSNILEFEQEYKNDLRNGIRKDYYRNGKVMNHSEWYNDTLITQIIYTRNDSIITK